VVRVLDSRENPDELSLMPDEQVILNLVELVERKNTLYKILSALLIVIGIFLLAFYYVGVILIIAGIYLYIRVRRSSGVRPTGRKYILTNKRAIEQNVDGSIKQVSLFESTPTVRNVRIESVSKTAYSEGAGSSTYTTQIEKGDVIFIKDGKVEVEFNDIESPKDVVATIEKIIKSGVQ
jgi:hypothetical protein